MTFKQCFDTSCVSAGRAKIARAFVKITFREKSAQPHKLLSEGKNDNS